MKLGKAEMLISSLSFGPCVIFGTHFCRLCNFVDDVCFGMYAKLLFFGIKGSVQDWNIYEMYQIKLKRVSIVPTWVL